MNARLIRIGNSRGVRLPKDLIELYELEEGDVLALEERREGILIRPVRNDVRQIGYADSYRQMASEAAESEEWTDWDGVRSDGIGD